MRFIKSLAHHLARARARMSARVRSPEEMNTLYLYLEIVFFGFLGAAASFDGAYVVRLGGSNTLVGLQSSLPALAAAALYLPLAHFLERRRNPFRWVMVSLTVMRLMYLFMILWPLLAMPVAAPLVVGTIVAMQLPAVLFSTGWSPLMVDVIPERARARVLSWRMIIMSATIGLLTFGFGFWLERAPFPLNYQVMYAVGVVGGIGSVLLVSRLKLPEPEAEEVQPSTTPAAPALQGLWQVLKENKYFRTMLVNTLVFNSGFWMVMPLYTILFIKQLGASDGWLGLRTMLLQAGGLVGWVVWRRVTEKWGEAKTLLVALPLVTTFPFLLAAFPNLTVILFLSVWVSLIAPGVDLPHSMIFMAQLPRRRRHIAVAIFNMSMNIAACVMPLIGVQLAAWIGLIPTLLVGGVLRAIGVGLFYWKPVKEGMSARALLRGSRARGKG